MNVRNSTLITVALLGVSLVAQGATIIKGDVQIPDSAGAGLEAAAIEAAVGKRARVGLHYGVKPTVVPEASTWFAAALLGFPFLVSGTRVLWRRRESKP